MKQKLTMEQFCKRNNISRRTLSRKIAEGKLRPEIIKSKQGTREYRFSIYDEAAYRHGEYPKGICPACGNSHRYSQKEIIGTMLDYLKTRMLYLISQ